MAGRNSALPTLTKPMPGYRLVNRLVRDAATERRALVSGLRAAPASIPPKYLYDELGCALYGAICQLPEYYPTRTESAIFARIAPRSPPLHRARKQFVDLGAGDCCKAEGGCRSSPARYIAVDIAAARSRAALARLAPEYPGGRDGRGRHRFLRRLDLDGVLADDPVLVLLPGFVHRQLHARRGALRSSPTCGDIARPPGSGLLIGVDGKKDKAGSTPPTTTRSASPQRSTATRCAT